MGEEKSWEDYQEYDFNTRIYYPWFSRKLSALSIILDRPTFDNFWEYIRDECSCSREQALEWWSLPDD